MAFSARFLIGDQIEVLDFSRHERGERFIAVNFVKFGNIAQIVPAALVDLRIVDDEDLYFGLFEHLPAQIVF